MNFLRASLSFAWLEFKALRFYPVNGVLQVIQSFVGVGIWFFVSLFLKDYAATSLDAYDGDFVAYMVVGVLFFQNVGTIMTLPFQSLSTAYWDKRLEIYHSQRHGIWAMITGRLLWTVLYQAAISAAILAFAVFFADVTLSRHIQVLPALLLYGVFILTCFGIGLVGASTFVFLEVKQGREPVTWLADVFARIFSGVYYPLTILPAWLRPVSWAIPHTHALQGIRQVMINGTGLGDLATRSAFFTLLLFCIIFVSLGIFLLNKALHQAERTNGVGIVV
ncbi:MAG: ABC transporter permease [Anaerolineae bacterium]|nr:ABC transporter permease [Anaerolineae bacterium]